MIYAGEDTSTEERFLAFCPPLSIFEEDTLVMPAAQLDSLRRAAAEGSGLLEWREMPTGLLRTFRPGCEDDIPTTHWRLPAAPPPDEEEDDDVLVEDDEPPL